MTVRGPDKRSLDRAVECPGAAFGRGEILDGKLGVVAVMDMAVPTGPACRVRRGLAGCGGSDETMPMGRSTQRDLRSPGCGQIERRTMIRCGPNPRGIVWCARGCRDVCSGNRGCGIGGLVAGRVRDRRGGPRRNHRIVGRCRRRGGRHRAGRGSSGRLPSRAGRSLAPPQIGGILLPDQPVFIGGAR